MGWKWNPVYGTLDLIGKTTVDSIISSKILPMVGTIPANSSGLIESIPYSGFFSVRYFCALQSASGKTASFDYSITTDNAGGVYEAVFGKIFGGLSYSISTAVISGNIRFIIDNNESDLMTWKVQKLGF